MYLHASGFKTDSRKNMEHSGVASFLSRHLSRYGNQHSQFHTQSLGNSSPSFNMKGFVPCFPHHSNLVCNTVKTSKQLTTSNDRRMATYSEISAINILPISYLVGGFVGSKSLTAMKGSSIQIWDIVLDKIYDMMNDQLVCSEDLGHQLDRFENSSSSPITENLPPKRTYASVMKMNPSIKPSDEYAELVMKYDNSRKSRRRGKSSSSSYRGDKKMNNPVKSCFNSSRWSNTRKKHGKKGAEKFNRREKMEAAKDGMDFINQEFGRDTQFNKSTSLKRPCITDKIMENLQMKGVAASTTESTTATPCRIRSTPSVSLYNLNANQAKSNFDKEKDCDRQQLMACKMKLDSEDISASKPRVNSESSIESEDSFIVFEPSDADNISCFSIESDSLSGSDDDDDASDSESDICSTYIFYGNTKFNDVAANHSASVPLFEKAMICLICKKNHNEHLDFPHSCENIIESPRNNITLNYVPDGRVSSAFADSKDRSKASCKLFINSKPNSDEENVPIYCDIDEESLLPTFVDPVSDIAAACDHDYQLPTYEEHFCSDNNHFNLLNKKWCQIFCDDNINQDSESSKSRKKVTFAPENRLVSVRTMRTWDYALRSARVGPWEVLARDSMRFCHRISRTEEILKPIFSEDHRTKIWLERFETQSADNSQQIPDKTLLNCLN
ncbi:uncharacterized protein LOC111061334 [Nilaparvata lugens]|uniref:uncharacterized protein LOC111061334 n=1 Tax=Nilaparvata lugens TaxID=108931 RepID=UPI00193CF2E5|nr:uncharacterized protein LOC111061334 [Nilaparvata lugens]